MKIFILTETHMVDEPDTGVQVFKSREAAYAEANDLVKNYEKSGFEVNWNNNDKVILDDHAGDVRVIQITEKEV